MHGAAQQESDGECPDGLDESYRGSCHALACSGGSDFGRVIRSIFALKRNVCLASSPQTPPPLNLMARVEINHPRRMKPAVSTYG